MGRSKRKSAASDTCECGHVREAHEHYRAGSECSLCDIRTCAEFRAIEVPVYAAK